MAFDEGLAERIRLALADADDLYERKMFGGIAFMVSGHMACGVVGDRLMLRLGPEGAAAALGRPHVLPMDFTGRPMSSMVYVTPEGIRADDDLAAWVGEATRFVATLPPGPRATAEGAGRPDRAAPDQPASSSSTWRMSVRARRSSRSRPRARSRSAADPCVAATRAVASRTSSRNTSVSNRLVVSR